MTAMPGMLALTIVLLGLHDAQVHAQGAGAATTIAANLWNNKMKDVTISFKDGRGQPIAANRISRLSLTQEGKTTMGFGLAVNIEKLQSIGGNVQAYQNTVKAFANCIVAENLNKWTFWEPTPGNFPNKALYDTHYVGWARANGIRVRWHPLEWYSPMAHHASHWSRSLSCSDYEKALYGRIVNVVNEYKDVIWAWDVFNEVTFEKGMLDKCNGWNTFFPQAFKLARSIDPDGYMCLNEMVILQSDIGEDKVDQFIGILQNLIRNGAPVNCVGLQAHLSPGNTNFDLIWRRISKIAAVIPNIIITEYSLNGDTITEDEWSWRTKTFLNMVMSHPAVLQADMWTFFDPTSYRPNGGFVRADYSWKPGAYGIQSLLNYDWSTTVSNVPANPQGSFTFRGYPGSYKYLLLLDGNYKDGWVWLWPSGSAMIY